MGSIAPVVIGIVALALALVAGLWLRKQDGRIRETPDVPADDLAGLLIDVGFTADRPAIIHFSADWCAPCKAVGRNVANVVSGFGDSPQSPQDIEIDIDAHPKLATHLKVLSLPTTVIVDRHGAQRFRASGVPSAADLRTALEPLTS